MDSDSAVDYFTSVQASQGWIMILESFARFVAPDSGCRLLDVGMGPGALVNIFRQNYAVSSFGLDCDPAMAERAVALYGASIDAVFCTGCLPVLPYRSAAFDTVTASNVLYLLDDPQPALHEMVRVLKPGGIFAMLNPSPQMSVDAAEAVAEEKKMAGFARANFLDWAYLAEQNRRWSTSDIENLFADAGLRLGSTRERIGPGLALYTRGIKQHK